MNHLENKLNYQVLGLSILVVFLCLLIGKFILQRWQTEFYSHESEDAAINRSDLLFNTTFISIFFVQFYSIISNWSYLPGYFRLAGFFLSVIGYIVFFTAVYMFKGYWRLGMPKKKPLILVTTGIYAYSRNPAFLGMDILMIGMLMMFFNEILLIFTIFAIIIFQMQIYREEEYLESVFGEDYLRYKRRIRRYFGRR